MIALDRGSAGAYTQLALLAYQANQLRKGDLARDKALELTEPDMRESLKGQLEGARSQAALQAAHADADAHPDAGREVARPPLQSGRHALVAQLAEQRTLNPKVPGSIPGGGTSERSPGIRARRPPPARLLRTDSAGPRAQAATRPSGPGRRRTRAERRAAVRARLPASRTGCGEVVHQITGQSLISSIPIDHPGNHLEVAVSATDELISFAKDYAKQFEKGDLPLLPRLKVAIVACMDARLLPARLFGLEEGDAHVIRNAGGVVTDDEIRSLAISQRLLQTEEIILVHHTDCGMLTFTDDEFERSLEQDTGLKPEWTAQSFHDLEEDVRRSIARITDSPFIPHKHSVRGFIYEVETGELREVS